MVDARLAMVFRMATGQMPISDAVSMVRGIGVDNLKKQFDAWRTTKTKDLSNVVLHENAFSVLDEWGLQQAKKAGRTS